MGQINDVKREKLKDLGFSGSIDDMETQFLSDLGAPSGTVNDMWIWVWVNIYSIVDIDAYNDMAFAFLEGEGYSGTLSDMWIEFWTNYT